MSSRWARSRPGWRVVVGRTPAARSRAPPRSLPVSRRLAVISRATVLAHAASQRIHQVDDLRLARCGRTLLQRLGALGAPLDQLEQVVAVFVTIFRRLPPGFHALHELLRHREFLRPHCAPRALRDGDADVRWLADLLVVTQQLRNKRSLERIDRHEILSRANHYLRQGDSLHLRQRVAEEQVGLFTPLDRSDNVGLGVVDQRDLVRRDEADDIDALGDLRIGPLEVLVREDHVAAGRHLIALDYVLLIDRLAGGLVDLEIPDAGHVSLVEQVQIKPLRRFGIVQLHADRYETEPDGAPPDPAGHTALLVSSGDGTARRGLHGSTGRRACMITVSRRLPCACNRSLSWLSSPKQPGRVPAPPSAPLSPSS